MTTTRRDPSKRPDEGRREQLLEAASRVIARDGIAAASTRRIAEEAGVPPGLVHYWFAGKDDLLESVIADNLSVVGGAVSEASLSDSGAGLLPPLAAAFEAIAEDDRGRQIAMFEMTCWALRRTELNKVARNQYASYRRIALEAVEASGATFPPDTDPAVVAQLLAALTDGLTLAWLADPEGTDVTAVLELAARALSDTPASE